MQICFSNLAAQFVYEIYSPWVSDPMATYKLGGGKICKFQFCSFSPRPQLTFKNVLNFFPEQHSWTNSNFLKVTGRILNIEFNMNIDNFNKPRSGFTKSRGTIQDFRSRQSWMVKSWSCWSKLLFFTSFEAHNLKANSLMKMLSLNYSI